MKKRYTISYDHIGGNIVHENLAWFELVHKVNDLEDNEFVLTSSIVITTQEVPA